jgi:PAS domain S-box-containing protein
MLKKPSYKELEQRVKELESVAHTNMQLAETLRRSEQQFRTALKGIPIPTAFLQKNEQDFAVVDYNTAAEIFIKNKSEKNIVDNTARKIWKNRTDIIESLNRCFNKKTTVTHDISYRMLATGEDKYLTLLFAYVPPDMVVLQFIDVTKHKLAEDELRESEQKYRQLIESARDIIYTVSLDATITSMNPAFESLSGWSSSECIGKPLPSLVHPDDWPLALEMGLLTLRGERPPIHEVRILSKSGEYVTGEFSITPFIQKGSVAGILGIGRDITELRRAEEALQKAHDELELRVKERTAELSKTNALLKREIAQRNLAQEALRESEKKYRFVVDNANDAIFIVQDEVVKFPNPKTSDLTGYSAEELSKISVVNLIHPEDMEMVRDRHQRRLSGKKPPATYSFRIFNKAREEIWVLLNTVLINWEGRPATLNFLRDMTQQKKFEDQFQHIQRMQSLGTLAGGIAHDFNNLLMGIQGNVLLMILDRQPSHPHYERLKNIEQYVRDGAELTKQLLGFARGGKYEVKPTNLNEIVKKSCEMFRRTRKEISIHSKFQENTWTTEVDRVQIEQVLLNLYVNAWQAMPRGGELYLQTENLTLDKSYVKPFEVNPGRYVKISITDTGVGMDEATQQRMFEPFFTTKGMGRGTGLGLASVYGIVKNHGGFVKVYSKKGQGTTFNIYFPASGKKVVVVEEKRSEDILTGTGTALLVDDEDMIIDVGKQLMQKLGYETFIAGSGKEAIEIYRMNKEEIDIVIVDMIMPGMSGGETYNKLKEINPDIKVLLSSGYSINGLATEILKRGCNGFIQKPFNMKDLSKKLREILDKKIND